MPGSRSVNQLFFEGLAVLSAARAQTLYTALRPIPRPTSPGPAPDAEAPPPTPRAGYRVLKAPWLGAGFGVWETAPVALSSVSAAGTMPSAALKSPRLRRVFVVGVGMTKVNGAVRPRGDREAWSGHGHRPHCCPIPPRVAWASERPLGVYGVAPRVEMSRVCSLSYFFFAFLFPPFSLLSL